ncbi:oxygenase MpaB family protein [Nocardia sp. alder85J]|uniref:oxygenase MpaB family protein n=1 Tax=Nocardia sp. alder85J TaxID=2862949 RepID=UPI001CD458B5|nr:oxygenase MpaB family protein [Nocardia sp. alder85J]MCX4096955.1 oxygenase MpaB family protein [Nocardia sp. alder85J]
MNSPVPHRHPATPRKVPGLRAFAVLLGIGNPSPQQWQALGEALLVGDEPMDRLVDWMSETGMATTRPLFEQALREGISSIPGAPEPLREFFGVYETVPEWVDWSAIRRAERVFRMGGTDGLYIARDVALLGGYLASGFNKTLIRTGALEKGPAKRFAETLQWALDVTSDDGMRPLGRGYRATMQVRLIHALVRRHLAAQPDWDAAEWGLPINQTDMAATLVGALISPFLGAMPMGILPARGELDAAAHLTRYVGWLIGVRDEWLPDGFRDSVRILYHCMTAITNPDETSAQLAMPMADDPLRWHYRNLSGLRGRIARAQHLSIASTFLGPSSMRQLGLPATMPPWYPLARVPVNLVRSALIRVLPGGTERAAAQGRRRQELFLRTLIGDRPAVIGESARTAA